MAGKAINAMAQTISISAVRLGVTVCLFDLHLFVVLKADMVAALLGLGGLLGDKCKQNIVCCDSSNATAVCYVLIAGMDMQLLTCCF